MRAVLDGFGKTGKYRIEPGGYDPEKEREFRYSSDQHAFRFWVLSEVSSSSDFTLNVHHAIPTRGEDLGAYRQVFEENIREYFRRFHATGSQVTAIDPPAKVIFTWSFAR